MATIAGIEIKAADFNEAFKDPNFGYFLIDALRGDPKAINFGLDGRANELYGHDSSVPTPVRRALGQHALILANASYQAYLDNLNAQKKDFNYATSAQQRNATSTLTF